MRCPQVWQNQHGRFCAVSYRLNTLSASHRSQKACSPSGANRSRQTCRRQVSSSGNSRTNSMNESDDSEESARIRLRRSTVGICRSLLARTRVGVQPGARSLYLSQILGVGSDVATPILSLKGIVPVKESATIEIVDRVRV